MGGFRTVCPSAAGFLAVPVALRSFGRRMRALFPETREHPSAPAKGWSINRKAPRPQ